MTGARVLDTPAARLRLVDGPAVVPEAWQPPAASFPAAVERDVEALRRTAEQAGRDLEGAAAGDVLRWAHAEFGSGLVVTASMADGVLSHLAGAAVPGISVLFLDTGYHFAETLGTRDAVAATTAVHVRTVAPLLSRREHEAEYGKLFQVDPDLCCAIRKVWPLDRALRPYSAWASGVRRVESTARAATPVVSWDARRRLVKINPLATWTDEQLHAYVDEHGILVNPLREMGFLSIGCAPCTRAVAPGEDPRAGRWSGRAKTECGLH